MLQQYHQDYYANAEVPQQQEEAHAYTDEKDRQQSMNELEQQMGEEESKAQEPKT